jgi:molybdenum cofactor biosynthesis enzyme MoaA
MLYMCLGQDDSADLRAVARQRRRALLMEAMDEAISRKPKGHDFIIDRRHMARRCSAYTSRAGAAVLHSYSSWSDQAAMTVSVAGRPRPSR